MYDTKLTTQERLEDLRKEHRLTLEQLAAHTGLSRAALGTYETDSSKDISHYAIIKLAKFYGVTADYLLGLSEMKNHPDAELNDLHLSDDMIELLRSGRVNTPLLCELALHKDFGKLLADIEIYVNGMAAAQIQNLNAWADVTRDELMEKYQPGDLNWAGFYLLEQDILVLGTFQGKPACIEIPVERGVCGTAVVEGKTQLVRDVHQFPGHIACDSASNSEIVVPIRAGGNIVGVLDVDSPHIGRFTEEDQAGLEKFVRILEAEVWL